MKPLRALMVILLMFGVVQILACKSPVDAQSGLPWSDTCTSERTTCQAAYTEDLNSCLSVCKGTIAAACKNECCFAICDAIEASNLVNDGSKRKARCFASLHSTALLHARQ